MHLHVQLILAWAIKLQPSQAAPLRQESGVGAGLGSSKTQSPLNGFVLAMFGFNRPTTVTTPDICLNVAGCDRCSKSLSKNQK